MITVSTIETGAGSNALSTRPIFPTTRLTSGILAMAASISESIVRETSPIEACGIVVGIYENDPHRKGIYSRPKPGNVFFSSDLTTLLFWMDVGKTSERAKPNRSRIRQIPRKWGNHKLSFMIEHPTQHSRVIHLKELKGPHDKGEQAEPAEIQGRSRFRAQRQPIPWPASSPDNQSDRCLQ